MFIGRQDIRLIFSDRIGDAIMLTPSAALTGNRRSTVSIRLLCALGEEFGVPQARCLTGSGVGAAELEDPQAEVSAAQEMRVISNLLASAGEVPGLGVLAGQRYHLTSYGIWGYALVSSPTLRSATELGIRYLDLTFAFARVTLEEEGGHARLYFHVDHLPAALQPFLVERDMAAVALLQRELFGVEPSRRTVGFRHAAPPDLTAHEAHFGVRPLFGAAHNYVGFDTALLDTPLPQANDHTRRLCEVQCQTLLQRRQANQGEAGQVRSLLLAEPSCMPDMEQVAARLNMTSRTLRRRLADEAAAFRGLQDEVRQALAQEWLAGGMLSVEQVAERLGYTEAASFIHAFRRWTGTTPGRWCRTRH